MGLLRHQLTSRCMEPVMDNHTKTVYSRGIRKFEEWVKDQGISQRKAARTDGCVELVQQYCDDLVAKGYTAATVHTYLAPVCKGYGINMADIDKPPRLASETTKGRTADKNLRGKKDAVSERDRLLMEWAGVCGLRRADYTRLNGQSIHYGKDGLPKCITCRSKGGKHVRQYILPGKQEKALSLLDEIAVKNGHISHVNIEKDERLFSPYEVKRCQADLHECRRQNAKDAYDYYSKIKDPETVKQLKQFLVKLYSEEKKGATEGQIRKFAHELTRGDYCLRGANAEKARAEGKPQRYDRLAVMCTSLMHLAHFRADVTIASYLAN